MKIFLFLVFLASSLMAEECVYYFAYGSNISANFLNERLKNGNWSSDGWHKTGEIEGIPPVDLGTYLLCDYEFGYTLDLNAETAGNVIPKSGGGVYGVLYKIAEAHLLALDREEDYSTDYERVALKPGIVTYNASDSRLFSL